MYENILQVQKLQLGERRRIRRVNKQCTRHGFSEGSKLYKIISMPSIGGVHKIRCTYEAFSSQVWAIARIAECYSSIVCFIFVCN